MSKIVKNNNFHTSDVINVISSRSSVRLKKTTIMQSFFSDSVSLSSSLGRGKFNFRIQNRVKNDGTQFKQGY